MKKWNPLVLALILVPAPFVFAQTMTVANSTSSTAACTTFEVSPKVTTPVTNSIAVNSSINTGLPADRSSLLSLELKQSNLDVAGTPLYLTGVLKATLSSACNAAVPPCLNLTPVTVTNPDGVKQANAFLAERSTTKEFCLPGTITTKDPARYFTLLNGLVVNLTGNLARIPTSGQACLCGVRATPPGPVNTISFAVHRLCDTK